MVERERYGAARWFRRRRIDDDKERCTENSDDKQQFNKLSLFGEWEIVCELVA